MKNIYQIKSRAVISAIVGDLPTDAEVCLPVSCLIFGMKGSFHINTAKEGSSQGNCFFVSAETTYKVTPLDCTGFVIVFFDAVSPEHYFLTVNYKDRGAVPLAWKANEDLLNRAFSKMSEAASDAFLEEVFQELFEQERKSIVPAYDERIVIVDEHIRKNIREKISNKELAEKVHLSESRFYHFFKEQTQVNVSRYILWLRLKIIFERYFKSEGKLNAFLALTNFTDLSHFIKSFRSFFGESPKRLLNR